jgi:hypothetical protein
MLGNNFDGTDTFWLDLDTGVWLKRTVAVTRGTAGAPFEVVRISTSG